MQCSVAWWRRLAERLDDASDAFYSPIAEVRFWLDADGYLNRDGDLPAVVYDDGTQVWFEHGLQVRSAGGPSHVAPKATRVHYLSPDSKGLAPTGHDGLPQRRMGGDRLPQQIVEEWTNAHGLLHRADGPARTWADGCCEHWHDGKLHREAGLPAIEYPRPYAGWLQGPDMFFENGKRHRTSGPACAPFVSATSGREGLGEYYLDGVHVPEVRDRWSVLRHYARGSDRGVLLADNTAAWDALVGLGAVNVRREAIESRALAAMLRVFPN